MPLRNLNVIFLAAVFSVLCSETAERNRYVAVLAEAMSVIESEYVEEVDSRNLFEGAMNGMVNSLGDPYSRFIPPPALTQFQEDLDQEFGGIGILVEVDQKTEQLTIMSPLVGTPAYKAGLRSGDIITSIDGHATKGLTLSDAVDIMRGPPGKAVALEIQRHGTENPIHYDILRAIIPTESVLGDTRNPDGSWNFYLAENERIGYIRITTFGDRTVEELTAAVAYENHPVDALILDLRGNAGGYLSAAIDTCDLFLNKGRIVSTRGRNGVERTKYDASAGVLFDENKPMAILADTYSASASEIVAACLQDHKRAVVVGVRTWGKGTVQNIIEMERGASALKLTTASYWRPSGVNIHRIHKGKEDTEEGDWGVRPNPGFEVPLTPEEFEKVIRRRRAKDINQYGIAAGQQPPVADEEPGGEKQADEEPANKDQPDDEQPANDDELFDDPQLRRAIDYLEEQVQARRASARKA